MNVTKKNQNQSAFGAKHHKFNRQLMSKKYTIIILFLSFCVLLLSFNIFNTSKPDSGAATDKLAMNQENDSLGIDGIKIQQKRTVQNLTVFMLSGKEKVKGRVYKTLSQAMDSKEVLVKETGSVNELSIDNNSGEYIFIHSGDIVKGGKQDRTISYDVIIPPHAKNVSLESFCVEQGRWQQRENETVSSFGSNSKMLSSRDLKLAAKYEKNQSKVWSKVAEQKDYLNEKLSSKNGYAVNVADAVSNSSLQLVLENEELNKVKKEFYNELNDLINTNDAIGYAYAINGKIYGVEVYNNHQLFKDLWEKILESIIVEAISKQGEKTDFSTSEKDVIAFIQAVKNDDKKTLKRVNKITSFQTTENKKGNIVFSTEDIQKKKWIHKSYMKRDSIASKESWNSINTQGRN